jgi:hypothetical protein
MPNYANLAHTVLRITSFYKSWTLQARIKPEREVCHILLANSYVYRFC